MSSDGITTSVGSGDARRQLSLQEAAGRAGGSAGTLALWGRQGLIPNYDGSWSTTAVAHARMVARLRERGHSLQDIHRATEEGRLAFGYVEELFPGPGEESFTLEQAGQETGLEPRLIERIIATLGGPA